MTCSSSRMDLPGEAKIHSGIKAVPGQTRVNGQTLIIKQTCATRLARVTSAYLLFARGDKPGSGRELGAFWEWAAVRLCILLMGKFSAASRSLGQKDAAPESPYYILGTHLQPAGDPILAGSPPTLSPPSA